MNQLPETGFLRESQILPQREVTEEEAKRNKELAAKRRLAAKKGARPKGQDLPCRPRKSTPGIIPVSHSTWWNGVKSGRFPKPVKIGRCTLWRVEDILELIRSTK